MLRVGAGKLRPAARKWSYPRRYSTGQTLVNPRHRLREAKSWLLWGPAFALSCAFLGAGFAASRYKPVEAEKKPDQHNVKEQKEEDSLPEALTKFFGLNDAEPNEEDAKQSLGWNGLGFLTNTPPVSSIVSITASWVFPTALIDLQSQISSLLVALGTGPNSLYAQVLEETMKSPECEWDARVRLGEELPIAERAFLRERGRKVRKAFAKFIGVDESEIDERDVPVVAVAASGGGYRAMTNTTGSLIGAEQSGLLDCITYMAGISGSCWALGVLYSGVAGSKLPSPELAGEHLKNRIAKTFLDTSTLEMLATEPTNKYLLSGLLLKASAPLGTVSLTDIYGTLVSSRLFIPADKTELDPDHLSLHKFRRFVDKGDMPLPIFTAIEHEIPKAEAESLSEVREQREWMLGFEDSKRYQMLKEEEMELERKTSWLWFEFTPFEVGCDELGAWIPSWSFGRRFENGVNIERRPELSFTILSGIYASAFCATLKDYFNEVQPILRQLPWSLYSWLEEIISDNQEDWGAIHPVVPNQLPNFVKGLDGQLREGSPSDITGRELLGFMDAGAELNIPYYPLLRRNVDCIIALDASADSQDLWFTKAEEYAAKKGLSTWPKGARWPAEIADSTNDAESDLRAAAVDRANRRLARAQEGEVSEQVSKQEQLEGPDRHIPAATNSEDDSANRPVARRPISSCTIWIGSSKDSDAEKSRFEDLTEEDLIKRDGIGIVYMPLVPHKDVPDMDPTTISTWRREMNREETEQLLTIARLNFLDGEEKIRKLLRAMWLRKRAAREREESLRTRLGL